MREEAFNVRAESPTFTLGYGPKVGLSALCVERMIHARSLCRTKAGPSGLLPEAPVSRPPLYIIHIKSIMPRHILFVCLGNICRSCTSEEIFRTLARRAGLDSRYEVDSAGIIDYHEGELPDARMRQTALRHGYRLTHRSRPIRPADFERFDLIIGMDDRNCDKLRRLAPTEEGKQKVAAMASYLRHHPEAGFIPDPYYGTEADFELVVELLEDACEGLLEKTNF